MQSNSQKPSDHVQNQFNTGFARYSRQLISDHVGYTYKLYSFSI